MDAQITPSNSTAGIRPAARVDPWLLISQVLQGTVAVAQLTNSAPPTTSFFSQRTTSLKPLVGTTLDLIHHADRVIRLLESDVSQPLDRPFTAGTSWMDLAGQDLREFNSIHSGLCLKTSSAHSWATMLAQHSSPIAQQVKADVTSLGNVPARVSRLYGGTFTGRHAVDEALQILGAFYDSMEQLSRTGSE